MALRDFVDSAGTPWKVWDVIPSWIREREGDTAPNAKAATDRSALLTPGLEQGWLCFESPSEKRRLTPIPPEWDQQSDAELEALCGTASPSPRVA